MDMDKMKVWQTERFADVLIVMPCGEFDDSRGGGLQRTNLPWHRFHKEHFTSTELVRARAGGGFTEDEPTSLRYRDFDADNIEDVKQRAFSIAKGYVDQFKNVTEEDVEVHVDIYKIECAGAFRLSGEALPDE